MSEPAVSIVVAAYGRSNVLRYALETVRRQTTKDWEVVIVDDASPDDVGGAVEQFRDSRMRVVRLVGNIGEQSGPNNAGVLLAAAPLIAFLNQDDLWLPDHLAHLIELKERSGAALVHSMLAMAWPPPATPDEATSTFALRAWRPRYDPQYDVPASSWLLDRSLHLGLGGWRPAGLCYGPSSQDFLFRAWRSGARIVPSSHLTVLAEGSANRPGSYRDRHEAWHRRTMERLSIDAGGYRREILAFAQPLDPDRTSRTVHGRGRQIAHQAFMRVLMRIGVSPQEWTFRRRGLGRGGYFATIRRTRGLE